MRVATTTRKPVDLHIHDPKKHIGAEEMQARQEAEITIGEFKFTPCADVKKNKHAFAKWKEIIKIYKAAEDQIGTFISSSDDGILNRYCMHYGDYFDLIAKRRELSAFSLPTETEEDWLLLNPEDYEKARLKRVFGILDYMTSLNALLRLEGFINSKSKAILDLEDRIFLNPAAKVRTLPIKRKNKKPGKVEGLDFDV